jgi:hypothetical protein
VLGTGHSLSPYFVLKRPVQPAQQSADRAYPLFQRVAIDRREKAEPKGQVDARLQFSVGAKGDGDVMRIHFRLPPTRSLGHI